MEKELIGSLELNMIYHRDCLSDGGMALIPDKSVDMILCDLPYGTTQNKWDSVIPFEPLWEQYNRIIKDTGAVVLFANQPFTTNLISSNFNAFKYCWTWKKSKVTGYLNAKKQPLRTIEDICVFYSKQCTYNPQMKKVKERFVSRSGGYSRDGVGYGEHKAISSSNNGEQNPFNFLEFKSIGKSLHPTQKPVELFEYLIRTYTDEGEIVLDNCMGSGTTAVAALNTNRKFIGFETEPAYVEIANKRIFDELSR
jgi:site-specific DNA-methyltransferase (adenine-specific)